MSPTIEIPRDDDELLEFIQFCDVINSKRSAYWPAFPPMVLPLLKGEGAEAQGRDVLPFVVRRGGEIAARALAIVDSHYLDRWNDEVGHVTMFEALPDTRDEVRVLMDQACGWLRERGMRAARAGFGLSDFPFAFGAGDTLPPVLIRNNPDYYHTLLKEAGFESERGWVDYRAEVTPTLVDRWRSCVEAVEAGGFRLVPYGEVDDSVRVDHWVSTWNEAFSQHWGVAPQTPDEHVELADFLGPLGMSETSVIAYDGDEPVGALWVVPELASMMANHPDRDLRPEERVNFLGIAVRERARGKGVNMGMAAFSYLDLVRRGAEYVSYTLVLDDNWPSRRTAEKLGAEICGNYIVYRRNFGR